MYKRQLYDRLDIKRTKEPGIQIQTNLSFLPVNENNLIYKAAKAERKAAKAAAKKAKQK